MKTTCLHCGDPLPEVKSNRREYCTVKCRRDAAYIRDRDKILVRQRRYYTVKGERTFTCEECGEDFTSTRSSAQFCSQSCASKNWYRNNPEKVAEQRQRAAQKRQAEAAARKAAIPVRVCAVEGCERTDIRPKREGTECDMHHQRTRRAAQRVAALGVRTCPECGADMSEARINAKYCSNTCTVAAGQERNKDRIRERRRLHQSTRRALNNGRVVVPFTLEQWEELAESLGNACTYCGITAEELSHHPVRKNGRGNRLEIDHIVPMTRNGAHALANLTPACPGCNQSKKARRLLFDWAPPLLGGVPRYDPSRPRGSKYIEFDPTAWRNETGPLPHIVAAAQAHPALLRAIRITEEAFALAA